ncbi:GNAT family protein [Nesterenkonia massiliensis]|uniref:GNAT family N-acetyltransferase n=1 Tax=Nesterenkonia massiliensis TaxID=1232429 RepID=UPI002D21A093|nr:GNAT family protein [Nesterenkonia massiliensis]
MAANDGLHRLQASVLVYNQASQTVLRTAGFQKIGLAEKYLKIAGQWQDHLLFQRLLDRD